MSEPKSVEAVDPAKRTSQITKPIDGNSTVITTAEDAKCYWNDEEFGSGVRITTGRKCYEANNGQWVEV